MDLYDYLLGLIRINIDIEITKETIAKESLLCFYYESSRRIRMASFMSRGKIVIRFA